MTVLAKQESGFTFTELVIAAALIGLLGGIMLPTLQPNLENEQLDSAARLSINWLNSLRQTSIQNSVPCRATWDLTNATLSGSCDNGVTAPGVLSLRAAANNGSLLIEVTTEPPDGNPPGSEPPNTWIFTPRGTSVTTGEANISLVNNANELGRCVRLTAPLALLRAGKRTTSELCDYTISF